MKIKISQNVVNEHLVLSEPMEGMIEGVSPKVEELLSGAHRLLCQASDLAASSPKSIDAQAVVNELAHAYNILRYTLKPGRRDQLAAKVIKNIPAFEAFWAEHSEPARTKAKKKPAKKAAAKAARK